MTVTRRTILTGALILIADQAAARGTYCSRHRDACRRRWKYQEEQLYRERARREALTPEQRRAEDMVYGQMNTERENRYQAWLRRERQRSASGDPTLKVFGGFLAATAAFVGGVIWVARR